MLNLSLNRARPGMMLAMPVYHPGAAGHILLKPGYEIDAPAIRRLGELRVHDLWIRYPALDHLMKFISPEVVRSHAALTRLLGSALDRAFFDAQAPMDYLSYACAVRNLVLNLSEHPGAQVLVGNVVHADSALVSHSSRVCLLSLVMGLKLDSYLMAERAKVGPIHARNVENLGVGALLHDVGILKLEPDVLDRYTRTHDDTDPAYQQHVRLGAEMVRGKVEPTAAAVVLHHHQRIDGNGYPIMPHPRGEEDRPLQGNEIHIFARIVALADRFDRLRNPWLPGGGVQLAGIPSVRVLNALVAETRRLLTDPIVTKALVHAAPAFAPGSIVGLASGLNAIVTGWTPLNPCRPKVCIIRGRLPEDGVPAEEQLGETIDLGKQTDSIVFAEGHDVAGDLFDPRHPTEFDVRVLIEPPAPRRRKVVARA